MTLIFICICGSRAAVFGIALRRLFQRAIEIRSVFADQGFFQKDVGRHFQPLSITARGTAHSLPGLIVHELMFPRVVDA